MHARVFVPSDQFQTQFKFFWMIFAIWKVLRFWTWSLQEVESIRRLIFAG